VNYFRRIKNETKKFKDFICWDKKENKNKKKERKNEAEKKKKKNNRYTYNIRHPNKLYLLQQFLNAMMYL
jgi:hypothetical protein